MLGHDRIHITEWFTNSPFSLLWTFLLLLFLFLHGHVQCAWPSYFYIFLKVEICIKYIWKLIIWKEFERI